LISLDADSGSVPHFGHNLVRVLITTGALNNTNSIQMLRAGTAAELTNPRFLYSSKML